MGIDHEDDDVGGVDGLQGLGDARLLNHIRNLAATAHARGVDQGELAAVARERHEDAVARGARHLARDHPLLTDEPVDERRLTDVRAADDSDADASIGHGVAIDDLGRVPSFEHQIHEVTTAVAVRRGDRMWLTEAERMEIRTSGRRVEPLGLVDREEHGLAGTTQLARHEVILGVRPVRASARNTSTSASATARSVCKRIGCSMPEGCSTRPPVSTTT